MSTAMPRAPLRLGVVGIGKIARDQHLPAIAASPDFILCSAASRHAGVDGIANFTNIEAMLAEGPAIDAVSICTPPAGRDAIARAAIGAGKHVMIEKPPGATVSEVVALADLAERAGVSLFASWHSREATGVDAAREWLASRAVKAVSVSWREDIRVWHPGQDWILGPGGFGVFDPGINALSIVTLILPDHLIVDAGELRIPQDRQSPIAASMAMRLGQDIPVSLELDFLKTGPQHWEIQVRTDQGALRLTDGGKRLWIDDVEERLNGDDGEYPRLYQRFAELTRSRRSDVDLRPLQLVADAFLVGKPIACDAFHF